MSFSTYFTYSNCPSSAEAIAIFSIKTLLLDEYFIGSNTYNPYSFTANSLIKVIFKTLPSNCTLNEFSVKPSTFSVPELGHGGQL